MGNSLSHLLTANNSRSYLSVATHLLTAQDTLTEHLQAFIFPCKIKRLSKSTIDNYLYQIGSLVVFCEKNGLTKLADVNPMVLRLFFVELEEHNNATSVLDYYKGIKRFFNWLVYDEVLQKSPMTKIEIARPSRYQQC